MAYRAAIAIRTVAVMLAALPATAAHGEPGEADRAPAAATTEQSGVQPQVSHVSPAPPSGSDQADGQQQKPTQVARQMPAGDQLSPNPRTVRMRRSAAAVQQALASADVAAAARAPGVLRDARIRARVAARLATATLPAKAAARLRHRDGGYGWVGPVFWPFAADDIVGYTLSGAADQAVVWNYGLADIDAGLFPPSAVDDLTGYLRLLSPEGIVSPDRDAAVPPATQAAERTIAVRLCGDANRSIGGLSADEVRAAIGADESQASVIEDVAIAAAQAGRMLAAACPDRMPLSAPARLDLMRRRLDAMLAGVDALQGPLQDLDTVLSEAQKAKLATLVISPSTGEGKTSAVSDARAPKPPGCAEAVAGASAWPQETIDRLVSPTAAQKSDVEALKAARAKAADLLKASCQPAVVATASARLAAIGQRLEAFQEAVTTIATALNTFYARLGPEQAANFDAVGPAIVPAAVPAAAPPQVAALPTPIPVVQGAQPAAQVASTDAPPQAAPAEAASERATQARPVREARVSRRHRHSVRFARRMRGPFNVLGGLFSLLR